MPLKPGDKAPDFTLTDQSGQDVQLSSLQGRRVLVYFYPKADTPGCTKQACGLNDILGDIGDTAVLGISPDKPTKQAKFAEKYGLGFPLLVGASRKSFLGTLLAAPDGAPRPVEGREDAVTALSVVLAQEGVWGVRVHDVRSTCDALRVLAALDAAREEG